MTTSILAGLDIPLYIGYGDVNSMMNLFTSGYRAVGDRFNILNKYSPFAFTSFNHLPEFKYIDMTFEEYCLANATDVFHKYPNAYLLWSGGVDSTLILACAKILGHKIPILCTKESIDEAPLLYKQLIKEKYDIILFDYTQEGWNQISQDKILLSGQNAQLTGEFVEHPDIVAHIHDNYKDTIREYLRAILYKYNLSKKIDENLEIYDSYAHYIGLDIQTVGEFKYSLEFTYRNYQISRIGIMTAKKRKYNFNSVSFWDTELTENYGRSHFKENLKRYDSYNNPKKYKPKSKSIINKVFRNINYEDKDECGSLRNYNLRKNKYTPIFLQRILKNDYNIDEYGNENIENNTNSALWLYNHKKNCINYLKENVDIDLYLRGKTK